MAYNSGYPVTYPYIQQTYQAPTNSIIWVQGEAGAKSYMVAPNTTVQLWDSEAQTIYLKSADASGMPSLRVLDYTIRENTQKGPGTAQISAVGSQVDNSTTYVTKAEFEAVKAQIEALTAKMKEAHND